MSKTFTKEDVASHAKGDSLYLVIDEDVYDVSKFQDEHPGKFHVPLRLCNLLYDSALMGGYQVFAITFADRHRKQVGKKVRQNMIMISRRIPY